MGIGVSVIRQDALEKVTGGAKYVEDLIPNHALVVKILHSTIASGVVKRIDVSKARELEGVELVLTYEDVPNRPFATVAHPKPLDPAREEIEDKLMLTREVRYYGDDIAAVVARDEVIAKRALELIEVEYEEFEPLTTVQDALKSGAHLIHQGYPKGNLMAELSYQVQEGKLITMDPEEVQKRKAELFDTPPKDGIFLDETYHVPMVQHAHIENIASLAYMEGKRVVVVTTTQAPHILRRIISEATGIGIGDIRVIKPYIGGAFGNKQEVLYEPLLVYITKLLNGRPVSIVLSREETFINSRVRHAMDFRVRSILKENGELYKSVELYSNKGSYASHAHAVPGHAITNVANIYIATEILGESYSVFTNLPSSAAMRGYGIPQISFAIEGQMDLLAAKAKIDPIEFRKRYAMKKGYLDSFDHFECKSNGLFECMEKGRELIRWDEKRARYPKENTGEVRKGVGMAVFTYKTGVYPLILENAGCRLILNQNGSLQVQVGATEIGQGSDTVFAQIVSEVLSIPESKICVSNVTDTDVAPYDPGSYASRQSYTTGHAVKEAALMLRKKILAWAAKMTGISEDNLELLYEHVYHNATRERLLSIEQVAVYALYNKEDSEYLTSETTKICKSNAFSFGACFADIAVDLPVGKIYVNDLVAVHDSGRIINPVLAKAQLHGAIAMSLGYALQEEMLFDQRTGRPLNPNFLDYKVPTSMDVPDFKVDFVEAYEPTGPFGNKSLGEPGIIPPAPAIRNALFHATGVAVNRLPMTSQVLIQHFQQAGLI